MQPVLPFECDPREREFTVWLENTDSQDLGIQRALIERYAPEMYQLAWGLLSGDKSEPVREAEILYVMRKVFNQAIKGLAGFQGQESVRSWLFHLTVQATRILERKPALLRQKGIRNNRSQKTIRSIPHHSSDSLQRKLLVCVRALEQDLRVVAILRYVHNLTLPEIAYILKSDTDRIHNRLVDVRKILLNGQPPQEDIIPPHEEFLNMIHAFLDGTLDVEISRNKKARTSRLSLHLENCRTCQDYFNRLSNLEIQLVKNLSLSWPSPGFSSDEIDEFLLTDKKRFRLPKLFEASWSKRRSISMELFWLGGVILLVLAVSWYLTRQDIHSGKPLFPSIPNLPPTPVSASGNVSRKVPNPVFNGISESNYILNPILTADGHRVIYELSTRKLVDGLLISTSQIRTYDQLTGDIQLVSYSFDDKTENGSSLNPSASADGRWIAFASTSSNLVENDRRMCLWENEETNCFDIFIRDMLSGDISRISISSEGDEADGNSVLPVISANGRWVAFWSSATNLVSQSQSTSNMIDQEPTRWNVYLRDLQSERIILIPIGRSGKSSEWPTTDLLSLSDDGRLLALSIQFGDDIHKKLRFNNSREVYLYDRELDSFEAVNLATDGTMGNGDSYNASLTPDGRFVVFTSEGSNLVESDHNQIADVFIRDRQKHFTERISMSSDGREGNHASGLFPDNIADWGTRSTISADGRLVIFFSTADNLGQGKIFPCHTRGWFPCSRVYIRDRQRMITQSVMQGQQLNAFYTYPTISSDGRWISLIQLDLECPRKPVCSVLFLLNHETKQFTQFINPIQVGSPTVTQRSENFTYLESSGNRVNHLEFSPSGKLLAAGSDNGTVSVWNVNENILVYHLEDHNLPVSSVAFSPDGKLLATGSFDGKVIIYRAEDGTRLFNLTGSGRSVSSLAFSPRGDMLSVGASGAAWNLDVDDRSFTTLDYYEYSGSQVNQIAFSPDGRLTAYALSDDTVWLRRTSNGEIIARLYGSRSSVLSVVFSPDGSYLASGSADGRVDLWKIEPNDQVTWSLYNILTLFHTSWVSDLDFSPDGRVLAVASLGSSVCLWKIPSGELITTLLGTTWDPALSLAFQPDGRSLAVSLSWGGVKIWPISPHK